MLTDFFDKKQLYFVKYGRGGILVGLNNNSEELKREAEIQHNRGDLADALNLVHSYKETNDAYEVGYESNGYIITRIMPISQISIEIYDTQ